MEKFIFVLLLIFSISFADEYMAVFDCSSSNEKFVLSRLFLIQKTAENFKENNLKELYGVKIKACNIALSRFNLKRKDIVDFVDIVKNSWQEIIILQNKDYAIVPFE